MSHIWSVRKVKVPVREDTCPGPSALWGREQQEAKESARTKVTITSRVWWCHWQWRFHHAVWFCIIITINFLIGIKSVIIMISFLPLPFPNWIRIILLVPSSKRTRTIQINKFHENLHIGNFLYLVNSQKQNADAFWQMGLFPR